MHRIAVLVLTAVLAGPLPAAAWGFDVHRFISTRAIALLPPEIRPFFAKHQTFLAEHSIDPDLWRNAGFLEEPPRHYLDFDAYGAYPFQDLPRSYEAAVAKFGAETLVKNGTIPWRADEIYGRLVKAFSLQKDGSAPYSLEDIKFFSAVMGHYVADAHVPFHAVLNHDGQLTNQHGIHARFESELFARYEGRLALAPRPLVPVKNARDFVFDTLLDSFRLVEGILAADRDAVRGRDRYDDRYFERFFEGARPALERRLADSLTAVASVITSAWAAGGKPDLPLVPRRPARPVRRSGGAP